MDWEANHPSYRRAKIKLKKISKKIITMIAKIRTNALDRYLNVGFSGLEVFNVKFQIWGRTPLTLRPQSTRHRPFKNPVSASVSTSALARG